MQFPPLVCRLRWLLVLVGLTAGPAWAIDGAFLEAQGAAAQGYSRSRSTEVTAVSSHRPWVWVAEKGGAKAYLAGCLHMGSDIDTFTFPAYLPYYERAVAVYFEVMLNAWQNPDVGQIMARRGYSSDRRPLSSFVSDSAWQQVRKVLQDDVGLFNHIRPMQPWLASLTLAQEGYRRAGLARNQGLEAYIQSCAAADQKPVGGLEKAQDQIYAMADARKADQEKSLLNSLENFRKRDFGSGVLRKAWRSGNEALLKQNFSVVGADDEVSFNLLAKRNQNWARKIEGLAPGKPILIVVGVEHLVAEPHSLVSLLRAAGWRVQRVGGSEESGAPKTAQSPAPRPS